MSRFIPAPADERERIMSSNSQVCSVPAQDRTLKFYTSICMSAIVLIDVLLNSYVNYNNFTFLITLITLQFHSQGVALRYVTLQVIIQCWDAGLQV